MLDIETDYATTCRNRASQRTYRAINQDSPYSGKGREGRSMGDVTEQEQEQEQTKEYQTIIVAGKDGMGWVATNPDSVFSAEAEQQRTQ